MACIYKEIEINAPPDQVWEAVRDVGAVHTRLARGFVIDTRLEDGARWVTFADRRVVRELILDISNGLRRLSYAAVGGRASHHNASIQVFAESGGKTRLIWITDVLPNNMKESIGRMVDMGAAAIKHTLESGTQA